MMEMSSCRKFCKFFHCLIFLCVAIQPLIAQPNINIEILTLRSKLLNEERVIYISLPENYPRRTTERFPVLYVTDADEQFTKVVAVQRLLAQEGFIPDIIVIGISHKDRVKDLTPTRNQIKQNDGSVRFPTSGDGDKFLSFIKTELIPRLERRYRTAPYRVLGGHSLGGLFAIHSMISSPGLFKGILALSPSMQWDGEVINRRAEDISSTMRGPRPLLYISLANEQGPIRPAFARLEKTLSDTWPSGSWNLIRFEVEDHDSVVGPSYSAGLRWIFRR